MVHLEVAVLKELKRRRLQQQESMEEDSSSSGRGGRRRKSLNKQVQYNNIIVKTLVCV